MHGAAAQRACLSPWSFRPGGVFALLAVTCLAGCGSGESNALKSSVAALREEVTLLQNSVDRLEEQLAAVQARQQTLAERPATRTDLGLPATLQRPRLKVVKVQPGSEQAGSEHGPAREPEPAPQADDSEASRPVIRGTGERIETHMPADSTSQTGCRPDQLRARGQGSGHTRERCPRLGSRGG
jgi:outer membrane murein-binding lipoprotein Lpp